MTNVAIEIPSRGFARPSRKSVTITLLLAMVPTLLYAYARGPLTCTSCQIATPKADTNTANFLKDIMFKDTLPFMMVPPGATYKICNATHCAEYRRDANGNFTGDKKTTNPQANPGGGGVSGDFGGMGGGGGWWDGGTGGGDPYSGKGTVIVSDPTIVQ